MDNLKDLPKFIERSIPIYMHFEISNAMRKVLGDTLPNKVLDFENAKLRELTKFLTIQQTATPNLKAFACRLNIVAKECEKQNRGMTPFVLGKDFSPDMNHEQSVMLSVFEKLAISDQLKKF